MGHEKLQNWQNCFYPKFCLSSTYMIMRERTASTRQCDSCFTLLSFALPFTDVPRYQRKCKIGSYAFANYENTTLGSDFSFFQLVLPTLVIRCQAPLTCSQSRASPIKDALQLANSQIFIK